MPTSSNRRTLTIDTQKKSRNSIDDAIDKGLYGYAVELAKAHLDLYPRDGFAWLHMARALTELSRFEEAEEAFDNAFKYCREILREIIFHYRAEMYKQQGNYSEAEKWYRQAVQENPENPGNYVFLGVLLVQRGNLSSSEEVYRQGIARNGAELDEIYANLGGVLVAQERYEEAVECFQRAIEIDPDYKWAKLRLRDANKALKIRKLSG